MNPGRAIAIVGAVLILAAMYGAWQCAWVSSGLEAYIEDAGRNLPSARPSDIYVFAGRRAIRSILVLAGLAAGSGAVCLFLAFCGRHRGRPAS